MKQIVKLVFVFAASASVLSCANPRDVGVSGEGYGIHASEVTLERYRDLKGDFIDLEPGNRDTSLSWSTLYQAMPGLPERQETKPDGTIEIKEATSTKLTFKNWGNDPEGLRAEVERRFMRALRSMIGDKALRADLVAAGQAHGIDPVLILSCALGEHTFNVGLTDRLQNLVDLAPKWAQKWALKFKSNGVDLVDLLQRQEFQTACAVPLKNGGTHAAYWDCVGQVWRSSFMGRMVEDPTKRCRGSKSNCFPASDFKWVFFNPLGTGYSYGFGQLDPLRALMVTDMVNKKSGLRLLSIERPEEIYEDIISQRTSVHYIAANVRLMIDTYKTKAGFDISKNPGIVASLYNLGGEGGRATNLYKNNLVSLKSGKLTYPLENYYGFYINLKEEVIRDAYARWKL